MNESIANSSLFVKAAEEYMNAYLASLPETDGYDHSFATAFESVMERLIRRFERGRQLRTIARRVAAVLLALSIGAGAFVGLNAEARMAVQNWIRRISSTNIIYSSTGCNSTGEVPEFEITWLPKNVELTDVVYMESIYIYAFKDKTSCEGVAGLQVCDMGDSNNLSLYTGEGVCTITEVTINGMHGEIVCHNDADYEIVWIDENGGHIYCLNSELDLDTMLRIARGNKIK